jgi:ubiquinone/menaquinone biosynthesis C-methylase UbiE
VLEYVRSLGISPDHAGAALDFGCGVGRLTRAMASHFGSCWGVDISPTMIRLAEEFNQQISNCHFCLNERDDLRAFADNNFAFVYTSIVLQHIRRTYVRRYLRELVRVLKPGGVFVFQVPDRDKAPVGAKMRERVRLKRAIRHALGGKTIDALRMEMHCLPEKEVRQVMAACPVKIRDIKLTNSSTGGFNGNLLFLEREPENGYVSKMYCVVKNH